MTQQNAPVLDKHRDEAAKAAGFIDWRFTKTLANLGDDRRDSILAHAQDKANLEALNNRLAEIEQFARDAGIDLSGHTPSPCPSCAAKDEAMEAFKADVSERVSAFDKMWESRQATRIRFLAKFSRFIIPPADPVADALKALIAEHGVEVSEAGFDAMLAWHKGELSRLPLGGAK